MHVKCTMLGYIFRVILFQMHGALYNEAGSVCPLRSLELFQAYVPTTGLLPVVFLISFFIEHTFIVS